MTPTAPDDLPGLAARESQPVPSWTPDRVAAFNAYVPLKVNRYAKPFPGGRSFDVYDVLTAFNVTCPAVAHAVKKLLCAGQRGHKDRATDIAEAQAALARAVELERTV